MSDNKYPDVMGRPIDRAEIIEGLWEAYRGMLRYERRKDPTVKGYPDMEMIIAHIDQHGLPPK